ncbi:hypothetical protein [Halomonas koreensis]|uniref:Trimeric autotransporter adhesin YadA-like head domain-containing protein n=1 Tax=Halomonas koreensis TaxID=245385 RepID=A0ABU1G2Y8_9GAMM|nr:hypothetical protein [Halomonas koreensis]MDR5867307.1 hypothetical protein [Halomonas koreensis]
MRYGFVNNFEQTLAADLAAGATTMTLDGGGSKLSAATTDFVYTLTLLNPSTGAKEIVHATGVSGDDVTIVREQEGTTAQSPWPSGTPVEMRLTAATADAFAQNQAPGARSDGNLALGYNATVDDSGGTIVSATVIGDGATSTAQSATVIGAYGSAAGFEGTALGRESQADGAQSLAGGAYAQAPADEAIAFGDHTVANANRAIALGAWTWSSGYQSIAIGYSLGPDEPDSVAIGAGVRLALAGGMVINAVPVLAKAPREYFDASTNNAAYLVASRVVLQTETLDLTMLGASFTLTMPTGSSNTSVLFIDSIDVVLLSVDTINTAPDIKLGTTSGGNDIMGATTITASAVHERQQASSLIPDQGVTAVHAEVATAADATAMTGRVVLHGYVMEV